METSQIHYHVAELRPVLKREQDRKRPIYTRSVLLPKLTVRAGTVPCTQRRRKGGVSKRQGSHISE